MQAVFHPAEKRGGKWYTFCYIVIGWSAKQSNINGIQNMFKFGHVMYLSKIANIIVC